MQTRNVNILFPMITVLMLASAAPAAADEATSDQAEIAYVEDMTSVVEESSDVVFDQDDVSVMVTYDNGTYVDVPHELTDGVIFATDDGESLFIDVVGAESADIAIEVANGLVVYENTDIDANTAVQALGEEGVRFLTEIMGPDAPTEYNFVMTVPEGGYMEMTPEGGVVIVDEYDEPVTIIDTPWAKDAVGNPIDVYYTISGDTITMHVDHFMAVAYPVIADPWYTKPIQWAAKKVAKYVVKREINTSIKDYYEDAGYYCPKYLPWFFCAASAQ